MQTHVRRIKIVTVQWVFFFQAEDGIRDGHVTGVQTCALPILVIAAWAAWSPEIRWLDHGRYQWQIAPLLWPISNRYVAKQWPWVSVARLQFTIRLLLAAWLWPKH